MAVVVVVTWPMLAVHSVGIRSMLGRLHHFCCRPVSWTCFFAGLTVFSGMSARPRSGFRQKFKSVNQFECCILQASWLPPLPEVRFLATKLSQSCLKPNNITCFCREQPLARRGFELQVMFCFDDQFVISKCMIVLVSEPSLCVVVDPHSGIRVRI